MNDGESSRLPTGWITLPLGNFIERIEAGANFKCEERPPREGETGVAKVSAVTWGEYDENESKTCHDVARITPELLIAPGDFLFSRANTINLVGACVVARRVTRRVMLSDKILRLRLRLRAVEPKWVLYFLRSPGGRAHIERLATGNQESMRNIGQDRLRSIPVPMASRLEQRRVVAAIEQHLSDIDAGVASLERVLANLKRYRAAVLKAACEGQLVPTEAELARKEGREYESGDVLLRRILVERRARWEANQFAKMSAKGQAPRDDRWKSRYEEPKAPDTSELPTLPEGWVWVSLGQVSSVQGGIQKQPKRAPRENKYPFLRVANVGRGRLNLTEVHEVELFGDELERLRLERGDLLIVEGNGSPTEIGRMALWDGSVENCVHQNHIIRARLSDGCLPVYVSAAWNSPGGMRRTTSIASSTSGLYTLSTSKVESLPIPLPPLVEQRRIITEVDRLLSIVDESEQAVHIQLARAQRLRQSVLKRAFEGKLVPQDPSDEPASSLLDRIRTAPVAPPTVNGSGRTSRRGRAKIVQADEGGLDDG